MLGKKDKKCKCHNYYHHEPEPLIKDNITFKYIDHTAMLIDVLDRFIELYKVKNDIIVDIALLHCLNIKICNADELRMEKERLIRNLEDYCKDKNNNDSDKKGNNII